MSGHNIIVVSTDPWDHYVWRRRHHVAWNLALNNKVLFIEPPLTIRQPFKEKILCWKHLFGLGRLRYKGRNLYTYSPWRFPLSLPFIDSRKLDRLNKKMIFGKLKKIVKKLSIHDPILWVYFKDTQYDYYGQFGEKLVVVDWYDKHTVNTAPLEFDWVRKALEENKRKEEKLLEKADIIFAVSKALYDDLKNSAHGEVYYIPQGVDYDSFVARPKHRTKNKTIKRLEKIKKPILAFLGSIHFAVDYELLDYIARCRPDWSVVLAGRDLMQIDSDKREFKTLISRDNVHYFGEIDKKAIPGFLSYSDICLMPYKTIDWCWYSGPLKLLEYLAAGKPIVAVKQRSDQGSEFINYASDKEAYLSEIKKLLEKGIDYELVEKRKQFAKENSWPKRVEQMLRIIENTIDNRSIKFRLINKASPMTRVNSSRE